MEKTYIADKQTLDQCKTTLDQCKATLEQTKSVVDKCQSILETEPVYGFIEHMDILAPGQRIEYIGLNANFTPMSMGSGGAVNLGSWASFEWLKANKPWMVRSDGTPDYRLDENDYTKKFDDGTESDVSNTDYDGGAFSWAKKIYKKEEMIGNDRIVKFSLTERPGFEPIGFKDLDGNILEGAWIPMFYGSIVNSKMRSLSGLQPEYNNSTSTQNNAITAVGDRAKFFGGSIMQTLIDLEIMFAKTTDVPAVFGAGNRSGYDSSIAPTNGVKQNAVVGGGQFYATADGKSLNKIFHSVVLGSYQQWMRDPYVLLVNGRFKVSRDYRYDLTGETYDDTGIVLPKILKADGGQNTGTFYPHKYHYVPGFGSLPVHPCKGSTSLGGCDGLWQNCEIVAVALRFGACYYGLYTGPRYWDLSTTAGGAYWDFGAALLLLPPVGVTV